MNLPEVRGARRARRGAHAVGRYVLWSLALLGTGAYPFIFDFVFDFGLARPFPPLDGLPKRPRSHNGHNDHPVLPPCHVERLCPGVPFTTEERALWRELEDIG